MKRQRTTDLPAKGVPLREVRQNSGLNQTEFGELFDLPQYAISLLELNGKGLTLTRAKRQEVETALGIRIAWPE